MISVGETVEKQECYMMQPLWKTAWQFFNWLKIELSFDPVITLLGVYGRIENMFAKAYRQMFIAA